MSEQEARDRPRPGNLAVEGEEVEALAEGKEKVTLSPTLSRLPLQVDSPESSELPTSHQSLSGALEVAGPDGRTAPSSEFRSTDRSMLVLRTSTLRSGTTGVVRLFIREAAVVVAEAVDSPVRRTCGVSNMMLMAAAASLLAMWRARIISMSEKSRPTTERTTAICSYVALFPIERASSRNPSAIPYG